MNKLQALLHQMYTFVHTLDSLIGYRVLSKDRIEDEIDYRNDVVIAFLTIEKILQDFDINQLKNEYLFCEIIGNIHIQLSAITWYFNDMCSNITKIIESDFCSPVVNQNTWDKDQSNNQVSVDGIIADLYEKMYEIDSLIGSSLFSIEQKQLEMQYHKKMIKSFNEVDIILREFKRGAFVDSNVFNLLSIDLKNMLCYLAWYFEHMHDCIRKLIQKYPFSEKFIRENS